ncbi:MAG: hypothetical protein RL621_1712 [Bacteroidota bacterium]|jgi:hypothetical protein
MRNLEQPLADLYTYITQEEKINQLISIVNVGWHIEHSLLVIIKIIETVSKSDPNKYKWKFSLPRTVVFTLNKFPRGKGKAPEVVKPKQVEKTDYDALFAEARTALAKLEKVDKNQFFLHPIFGNLNKKNTFIMLDIHTKHHLKIIREIINS